MAATYARRLQRSGIDPDRVWDLADVTGLPDANVEVLIAPDAYVAAVNGAILRHQPHSATLDVGDLPLAKRGKFVEKWCEDNGVSPPSKRIVAQRIVDASRTQAVVAQDHRASLTLLLENIASQLPSESQGA